MLVWDHALLTSKDASWTPSSGGARDGGRTLGGSRRVANWAAGGVWRASLPGVFVNTVEQILAVQALDAMLDQGAGLIEVPRLPGDLSPGGTSTAADDAEAFATEIVFARPSAQPPIQAGMDFGYVDGEGTPRLHRVGAITDTTVDGSDTLYTVEIRPPLRAAIADGTALNWTDPSCVMRLSAASADALAIMVEKRRWGRFDVEFVEA